MDLLLDLPADSDWFTDGSDCGFNYSAYCWIFQWIYTPRSSSFDQAVKLMLYLSLPGPNPRLDEQGIQGVSMNTAMCRKESEEGPAC